MRSAFYCILLMSAAGSVAFVLVKALAALFSKRLSAGWHYTALKCSTLFFAVPLALLGLFLPAKTPVVAQGLGFVRPYLSTAATATTQLMPFAGAPAVKGEALRFIPFIWVIGFCLVLLWQVFCFIKFRKSIASTSSANAKLYDTARQCQSELGIRRGFSLLINNKISTPMLVGLVTPKILLPNSAIADEHAAYILRHELIHFKRGDLWVKMGVVLLNALHWFNPLMFLLAKELDQWCEYSCDEKLTYSLSREQCKQYGMAILCSIVPASKANTSFTTSFVSGKIQIERRLNFMLNSKKSGLLGKAMAVVLAAFMLTIGTVTAFAGSQMSAVASTPAVPATITPAAPTPAAPTPAASVAPADLRVSFEQLEVYIDEEEAPAVAAKPVTPAVPAEPKELDRVSTVLGAEEQQKLIDEGLIPRAGARCQKCGRGEYMIETDRRVSPTRHTACAYYARGNDELTTYYYFSTVTCNTCGYSYTNDREEEKIVCKGFS